MAAETKGQPRAESTRVPVLRRSSASGHTLLRARTWLCWSRPSRLRRACATLSPADCPRWLGAARQGPRRTEAQGQPGAPASLDTPRLATRAPAHLPWSRACLGCCSGFHRQVPCFLPLNSSPSAKSCHLHVSIRLAYSNVRGTSLAPEPS